jgi:hypothetical protein
VEHENFILNSSPIEVASYTNYKEATFLISVLGEPDLKGRIIPEDAGEKFHKTIIGFPVVAKLKKNIFGEPVDFEGHELIVTKDKNGKKQRRFGTMPIGSVIDSWIEEREVDGYEGTPKCILIKCKLWSSRFPEYFKVFDKLWDQGNISSSWELTSTDVEKTDQNTIYKVFEFIGNCVLGTRHVSCVPHAGVIEYAELEDFDAELADALEKDMADLDIENNEEMEVVDLAEKEKKETPVEDTEKKEIEISEAVADVECAKEKDDAADCAEAEVPANDDSETETASLTVDDLYRRISDACRKAIKPFCGYISYWFPEEKTVWYKTDDPDATALDYKVFTYEVVDDEVIVSEPHDAKLTVSIADINTVIAEKDEKINALTAELEIKDDAVIKAGEKISKLNVEISELKPYKEAAEKAEQERIEAEIAEAKLTLKNNMLKTKLFTEEEVAEAEIAELIESRNETAIKNLIAERYIASFDNDNSAVATETASYEEESNASVASLEVDDIDENPSAFMKNLLTRKSK